MKCQEPIGGLAYPQRFSRYLMAMYKSIFLYCRIFLKFLIDISDQLLISESFPDTITSHEHESKDITHFYYLSYGVSSIFFTSGTAIISCSCTFSWLSFLYSRSPSALERLRLPKIYIKSIPLTLPSLTKPPAFSILYFSSMLSGL